MAQETYYELLYLIDSGVKDEDVEGVSSKVKSMIERAEGAVLDSLSLGRKRLGYPVQKQRQGHYLLMNFTMDQSNMKGLNHALTMASEVMRHTMVLRPKSFLEKKDILPAMLEKEREAAHLVTMEREPVVVPESAEIQEQPSPSEVFSMEDLDKKLDEILKT